MNLKDLIKKHNVKTKMTMVSFKIPEYEKDLIEDVSAEGNISRSKLLRLFVSEGLFQLFGNPKYIEDMVCPFCDSKSIYRTNKGRKSAEGKSIYRCGNNHLFVYKSLEYNKQKSINEYIKNE
jgi:hypothetical protein